MAFPARHHHATRGFQPLGHTSTAGDTWCPPILGLARVSLPLVNSDGALMTTRAGAMHGTVVVVWPSDRTGTVRLDRLDQAVVGCWWLSERDAASLSELETDWPAGRHDYLVGSTDAELRPRPCSESLLRALGDREPLLARSLRAAVEQLRSQMEHV